MKTDDYIRLIREAIEETKDVDEKYRVAAFQEILGYLLERAAPKPLESGQHPLAKDGRVESIGEVLTRTTSDAHTDVTLVMAYYLLRYKNIESFTMSDIDALYKEARHPKTNVSLAIIGNVKKGFMIDTGEKRDGLKVFAVSRLGESHVGQELIKRPDVGE